MVAQKNSEACNTAATERCLHLRSRACPFSQILSNPELCSSEATCSTAEKWCEMYETVICMVCAYLEQQTTGCLLNIPAVNTTK